MANVERAARASDAIEYYSHEPGIEPVEDAGLQTTLQDLLTDMMHLANQEGIDWEEVQRVAVYHFEVEQKASQSRKDWDPRG